MGRAKTLPIKITLNYILYIGKEENKYMHETKIYNEKGMLVTKPFIFTNNGSTDFYNNQSKVNIIESAPVDNRKKSFYFQMTKDNDLNYELYVRFNPSRIIQTVGSVISLGNTVKSFFN